jgi:acetoin utilization deacetylase AcuC-like enzyme
MRARRNYPFHEITGCLDVELDDGTTDVEYLARLADALPQVLAGSSPDLVVYQAGADPHEADRLGRLGLTFDRLARRDTLVLQTCREVGIPVAITIAGGYGRDVESTLEVHERTVRVAREFS